MTRSYLPLIFVLVVFILSFAGVVTFAEEDKDTTKSKESETQTKDESIGEREVKVIFLDVGHGGVDIGASNKSGEEKQYNLDVANRVQTMLESKGFAVTLSRDKDIFVSLTNRAKLAEASEADLFISIHHSSSGNRAIKGVEAYVGKKQAANSQRLADTLLENLVKLTKATSRGTKRYDLKVLKELTMPSVLLECGFLSNIYEAGQIDDPDYREKVAAGITKGIIQFFKN